MSLRCAGWRKDMSMIYKAIEDADVEQAKNELENARDAGKLHEVFYISFVCDDTPHGRYSTPIHYAIETAAQTIYAIQNNKDTSKNIKVLIDIIKIIILLIRFGFDIDKSDFDMSNANTHPISASAAGKNCNIDIISDAVNGKLSDEDAEMLTTADSILNYTSKEE